MGRVLDQPAHSGEALAERHAAGPAQRRLMTRLECDVGVQRHVRGGPLARGALDAHHTGEAVLLQPEVVATMAEVLARTARIGCPLRGFAPPAAAAAGAGPEPGRSRAGAGGAGGVAGAPATASGSSPSASLAVECHDVVRSPAPSTALAMQASLRRWRRRRRRRRRARARGRVPRRPSRHCRRPERRRRRRRPWAPSLAAGRRGTAVAPRPRLPTVFEELTRDRAEVGGHVRRGRRHHRRPRAATRAHPFRAPPDGRAPGSGATAPSSPSARLEPRRIRAAFGRSLRRRHRRRRHRHHHRCRAC